MGNFRILKIDFDYKNTIVKFYYSISVEHLEFKTGAYSSLHKAHLHSPVCYIHSVRGHDAYFREESMGEPMGACFCHRGESTHKRGTRSTDVSSRQVVDKMKKIHITGFLSFECL